MEIYLLTAGTNRIRIKAAEEADDPAPLPEWFHDQKTPVEELEGKVMVLTAMPGLTAIAGRRVSMGQLAEALERPLGAPVRDQSGLTGKYYFAFQFALENGPSDTEAPSTFTAIQQNLGLKLVKRKGPVETLVVDHIETVPTGN